MRLILLALLLGTSQAAYVSAQELPRVLILGTGGTIAGEQREPGTQEGYEIRRQIRDILASVPETGRYARLETEQFSNISSNGITPVQWLQLARRINAVFRQRPEIAGIVVTHGTTRLEETAFFLHLTIKSEKPVVVVGAQRPGTGISPDGPLNLLAAVRVAAAAESRGKGTLVVMDERVVSARDSEKMYARSGGFDTREMGTIGIVAPHGVEYFYEPTRKHTVNSEFDTGTLTDLPDVEIHYSYAGSGGVKPRDGVKGVVVATTGLSTVERMYYEELQRGGVVIAATFPSGDQVGSPAPRDSTAPLAVERLSPVHARILLMLALTKTSDRRELQRIFKEY
jgi:L-asparaginase type II